MMKRIGKIIFRTVIIISLSFIVLCFLFDAFVQFRMNDKDVNRFFAEKHLDASLHYYDANNRAIRYLSIGKDTSTAVLFIHGAPSSLTYWKDYLSDSSLLSNFSMCAVDRPGYGYSGFGKPLTSIQDQAACIKPILDSLHKTNKPVILVAASYGTAIACRLTMDYPDLVNGLVLIAPALAPGEEKTYWFTPIIEAGHLYWFVPRMFVSANSEKVHHKKELEKMLPYWQNIHVPVEYIQGADDGLVYTSNAAFAKEHLTNVPYLNIEFIPKRGHLLAFKEKEKIKKVILGMKSRVKE